jgi:hypothetical protein
MKLIACLCAALAAGCGVPLGVQLRAAIGDACGLSEILGSLRWQTPRLAAQAIPTLCDPHLP